jgi:hypothetical protein
MRGAAAAAIALALAAAPTRADTPLVALIFGADSLSAASADIRSVRRVDEGARGAALVIRLNGGFDAQMSALTRAHVGETGELRICGELVVKPVLQSPIHEATFVISDTDIARIDRLQALLAGPDCGPLPQS